MGSSASRLIEWPVAEERLGDELVQRLRAAFDTKARKGRLSRGVFASQVLGTAVPGRVAHQLCAAFDMKNKGHLVWEDFIVGVAVLLTGTLEEKEQLLVMVYDADRDGLVSKDDMKAMLAVDVMDPTIAKSNEALTAIVEEAFAQRAQEDNPKPRLAEDHMSRVQFVAWANGRQDTILTAWLHAEGQSMLPSVEQLQQALEIPPLDDGEEDVRLLAMSGSMGEAGDGARPGFDDARLDEMVRAVQKSLCVPMLGHISPQQLATALRVSLQQEDTDAVPQSPSDKGKADEQEEDAISSAAADVDAGVHDELVNALAHKFGNADGKIHLKSMIADLYPCAHGTVEEEIRYLFTLFDTQQRGHLEGQAVGDVASALHHTVVDRPVDSKETLRSDIVSEAVDSETGTLGMAAFVAWVQAKASRVEGAHRLRLMLNEFAGVLPSTAADERYIVERIRNERVMQDGDTWYLVSTPWFNRWMAHVKGEAEPMDDGGDDAAPLHGVGPIDNEALLAAGSLHEVTPGLKEDEDYLVVPPPMWACLHYWYGGGPVLTARAITRIVNDEVHLEAEVYPITVVVELVKKKPAPGAVRVKKVADGEAMLHVPSQDSMEWTISRGLEVKRFLTRLCQQAREPEFAARMWHIDGEVLAPVNDLDQNVDAAGWADGDRIVLEIARRDNTWPLDDEDNPSPVVVAQAEDVPRGIVGLFNLGNTCYMNAALQALSNSPLLRDYFVQLLYLKEINLHNRDGHNGKFAYRFGDLLRLLWGPAEDIRAAQTFRSARLAVPPSALKRCIGSAHREFQGYRQHDSQELLSIVVDGLHEDLNRINEKPYVEDPEAPGETIVKLGDMFWDAYRQRNDSVMIDLFCGQMRSTLSCSVCDWKSIKFDPFMSLSVPLPTEKFRLIEILYHAPEAGVVPIKYGVRVPASGTIADLKAALKEQSGVSPRRVVLCSVSRGLIVRMHADMSRVARIRDHEVVQAYAVIGYHERLNNFVQTYSMSSGGTKVSGKNSNKPKAKGFRARFAQLCGRSPKVDKDSPEARAQEEAKRRMEGTTQEDSAPEGHTEDKSDKAEGSGETTSKQDAPSSSQGADAAADASNPQEEAAEKPKKAGRDIVYVECLHRKLLPQDVYFLNPVTSSVFGSPLLLSMLAEELTVAHLYEMIWERVKGFTMGLTAKVVPFQLRLTDEQGKICSRCPWNSLCPGCVVTDDLLDTERRLTVCIDWDLAILRRNFDQASMDAFIVHPSVAEQTAIQESPINLQECLDLFVVEEDIDDCYCSQCQEFHPAKKKLELWKLPPLLVIHLKRFQNVRRDQWVKSRKLVNFPIADFDLASGMADRAGTVPVKKERPNEGDEDGTGGDTNDGDDAEGDGAKAVPAATSARPSGDEGSDDGAAKADGAVASGKADASEERVDMVEDSHDGSSAPPSTLYDLYAITNHFGGLGSGHYTCYARALEAQAWHHFDDSSVRPVKESDLVTPAAYVLFYQAKDLAERGPVLPVFDESVADVPEPKDRFCSLA